jgi:DtxR family transcriptional regulator, Mn-dependent transcriptional regulator
MSLSAKTLPENHPSPTIEDYLAAIYVMERDGEAIIAARLAEALDVSPPTVTVTLKRMERDGWLVNKTPKGIGLTQAGFEAACDVTRRHMLTEWLLARVLKVPWSHIHNEAHHIEHTISREIEQQMLANLDNPQLCPHGNPLPGYEALSASWIQLTSLPVGTGMVIRRIHETAEDDSQLLQYLEINGIVPGAWAVITDILPFNQTLTLSIGEKKAILGFASARYIWVELIPERTPGQ